jgi:hypothetical protein
MIALTGFIATSLEDFFFLKLLVFLFWNIFYCPTKLSYWGGGCALWCIYLWYLYCDFFMLSSQVTGWLQLQLDTDYLQSWHDCDLMNWSISKARIEPIMPLGHACNVMYSSTVGTFLILHCCFVCCQGITHLLYGTQLLVLLYMQKNLNAYSRNL